MSSCLPGSLHFAHVVPSTAPCGPCPLSEASWALPAVQLQAQGLQPVWNSGCLCPHLAWLRPNCAGKAPIFTVAPARGWLPSSWLSAGRTTQRGWASKALLCALRSVALLGARLARLAGCGRTGLKLASCRTISALLWKCPLLLGRKGVTKGALSQLPP